MVLNISELRPRPDPYTTVQGLGFRVPYTGLLPKCNFRQVPAAVILKHRLDFLADFVILWRFGACRGQESRTLFKAFAYRCLRHSCHRRTKLERNALRLRKGVADTRSGAWVHGSPRVLVVPWLYDGNRTLRGNPKPKNGNRTLKGNNLQSLQGTGAFRSLRTTGFRGLAFRAL